MHFFPLSIVILNLMNNLIQVTFIEYLLYVDQYVECEYTDSNNTKAVTFRCSQSESRDWHINTKLLHLSVTQFPHY